MQPPHDALQRLGRMAPPDLILLDLAMPQMDGWEFCDRLRHDPALSDIPVVVLTAAADLTPGGGPAALTVVEKPVHADALLALVAQHCRPTLPIPPTEPGGARHGAATARR